MVTHSDEELDKGDMLHEAKRDKRLDRIWELEDKVSRLLTELGMADGRIAEKDAEIARLREALANIIRHQAKVAPTLSAHCVTTRIATEALRGNSQ